MGLVLLAMPWAALGLSNSLGRARKENVTLAQLFDNCRNINVLSASRVFLFGSRDLWFEVPLPFFLRTLRLALDGPVPPLAPFSPPLLSCTARCRAGRRSWRWAPSASPPRPTSTLPAWWCASLAVPLTILAGLMLGTDIFAPSSDNAPAVTSLTVLLYTYCLLFAVNSAIHSYLIVRYAQGSKVAMQVGV